MGYITSARHSRSAKVAASSQNQSRVKLANFRLRLVTISYHWCVRKLFLYMELKSDWKFIPKWHYASQPSFNSSSQSPPQHCLGGAVVDPSTSAALTRFREMPRILPQLSLAISSTNKSQHMTWSVKT